MSRPPLEVADVFRAHARDFAQACGGVVLPTRKKVLRALVVCRTAALGGYHYVCSEECGYERFAYRSCGNRHCPKCQAAAQAEWIEDRAADLLPVEYFHVGQPCQASRIGGPVGGGPPLPTLCHEGGREST